MLTRKWFIKYHPEDGFWHVEWEGCSTHYSYQSYQDARDALMMVREEDRLDNEAEARRNRFGFTDRFEPTFWGDEDEHWEPPTGA